MGRPEQRGHYPEATRIELLERDADAWDARLEELKDETVEAIDRMSKRFGTLTAAAYGLLMMIAGTCITILITSGVGR